MGYNQSDKELILRHLDGVKNVLDLGSQNDYTTQNTDQPPFVSEWYKSMGIKYECIDIAGDNGAIPINLAYDIGEQDVPYFNPCIPKGGFDLTVDCGTKEHLAQAASYPVTSFHNGYINSVYPKDVTDSLKGFYWGWNDQFFLTKVDGIIISINPKTGNWPGHGYHYIPEEFYIHLEAMSDISIIELYEHPACGNTIDGFNICAALKKTGNNFPSFEEFSKLPIFDK